MVGVLIGSLWLVVREVYVPQLIEEALYDVFFGGEVVEIVVMFFDGALIEAEVAEDVG